MDPKRRKLIKAVATGIIGGVVGGITGEIGVNIFSTIYRSDKDVGEVEKDALSVLFGETEQIPSIYAGVGNLQGNAIGIKSASGYLNYSAEQFTSYILRALRPTLNVVDTNEGNEFTYDHRRNSLFLGGPAANIITAKLLGYNCISVPCAGTAKEMPVIDIGNKRTRWAQIHGETDYGVYQGKKLVAKRYSLSTGKEVERPVFKMFDKKTGKILVPEIKDDFLMSEWLTIVRLREVESYTVIIGGMHGHSTEAFCRNITNSIEKLERIVAGADQYQLIVPVMLEHKEDKLGKRYTSGQIAWEDALVENISA